MVNNMIEAAVGGAIGAYVVYEFVNALSYTGPGEQLLPLLSFVVIAVAVLEVMDEGM